MRSMLSERDHASLTDILFNVDLAERFVAGLSYDDFIDDMRTFYALTRCLEIISEASRRLSDALMARHPDIPWRQIAGAGNVYRHDYEDVLHRLIWGTVHGFLPALRAAIEAELAGQA